MTPSPFERLHELMADRAIGGLTDAESAELLRLLNDFPDESDDAYDLTAAAVAIGGISPDAPLPARLRDSVLATAEEHFSVRPATRAEVVAFQPPARRPEKPSNWVQWSGWLAAAACLVIAVGLGLQRPVGPGPTPDPAREYRELISLQKDTVKASWSPTGDPGAKDVKGDVIWSNARQKGFMRFEGLPVNARDLAVYQLWIFDGTQDERYPIDGGVFDISSGGEVIVPIKAQIDVKQPVMFAVTVEKPGGVVVSKRERLLVIAKVGTDGRTAWSVRPFDESGPKLSLAATFPH
jgi:anti-sigma-K factor RskA